MSSFPQLTLEAMFTELVGANEVVMQAVDSTNDYDEASTEFLSDVDSGSFLGDAEIMTTVTFAAGQFESDPVALANILAGEFVTGVLIYIDTGSPATSRVLEFVDRNADNTVMNKEGDGSTMTVTAPSNVWGRI